MIQRFQSFITGITICYKSIQKIKSLEMAEFGLKGTHAMCIFFLNHNENITAAQLCQLCSEDKAAISRTLMTLQEKGYIQSDEKRYRSHLRLSDSGKEIAEKLDELVLQWVAFGGDGLSEEERETFYHALEVIADNLQESLEKN